MPASAQAPDLPNPGASSEQSWAALAQRLMEQGRLDDALAVLNARLATDPVDTQARFLTGLIALARSEHQQAIRIFRAILIDHPDATRVRLELARAFFLAEDFGNALRQFQFALAGNPPPAVVANIERYVGAIRQQKSISYSFGIALAPDSNLNTGSSAREVILFGLPFDLSEETRQRTGIGLALEASGEWAPRLGKTTRLRVGAKGQRNDYSGADYDDMTISAYAGPRVVTGQWDLSLLGTAYGRWYGGSVYSRGEGVRIEAAYYPGPTTAVAGSLGAQQVRYTNHSARDGHVLSLNGAFFQAITSSSSISMKAGASRQTARDRSFSNWSGFVAAGYFRELPWGFSAYVEPSLAHIRYDARGLGFNEVRRDTSQSVLVSLLNRRVVLSRFTPRISYTFTRNGSSLPLYRFNRSRLEVGLTTVF